MKVVVAGGTGFIGRSLILDLTAAGHTVAVLTRGPDRAPQEAGGVAHIRWDGRRPGSWTAALSGSDAVINLAGANIGTGRWTPERKARILASRVQSARVLVQALSLIHI